MDVVDKIAAQQTGMKNRMRDVPLTPIIIQKVSIVTERPKTPSSVSIQ